ncbi:hypothetical protein ACOSQ4_002671 [Xanthoceras sorbifolium]
MTVSSHEGTSHVMEEIPVGIPLVELPGDVAGPCPIGPSRPLGLLLVNPASVLKEEDVMRIRYSYGIPDGVTPRAPFKWERPDWDIPKWTCFYELPFQQVGFKLPGKVLDHFELALGQLMPNSWRILLRLDLLCTREGIVFELPDLFYTYSMREYDTEKGRYNLNLRVNRKHLITELTTNDRSWKDMYFFARGLLVKWPIGDSVVRTTWSKASGSLTLLCRVIRLYTCSRTVLNFLFVFLYCSKHWSSPSHGWSDLCDAYS